MPGWELIGPEHLAYFLDFARLTRSRTWAYRRGVASMTSFSIDDFWSLSAACGLQPHSVRLVPRNQLDSRYAYFFLTRA